MKYIFIISSFGVTDIVIFQEQIWLNLKKLVLRQL